MVMLRAVMPFPVVGLPVGHVAAVEPVRSTSSEVTLQALI